MSGRWRSFEQGYPLVAGDGEPAQALGAYVRYVAVYRSLRRVRLEGNPYDFGEPFPASCRR
jgi:hypothetical protein